MHSVLLLGGVIFDKILTVEAYPASGEDTIITSENIIPSGCSLNTAVTMKSFHLEPYIVGTIGKEGSEDILSYLKERDLPPDAIRITESGETGYCLTVVDPSGERTFFTKKGAETSFEESMIPSLNYSAIYLTGYFLLDRMQAEKVLAYLRTCSAPIFFDPGVLISQVEKPLLQSILDLCYAITPNEREYELLEEYNLENIELIIIKRGKGRITAESKEGSFTCYPYDVPTVDTTGAGDCFIGTLIAKLLEGTSFIEALRMSSAAASYMTGIQGPHTLFDPADIRKIRETTQELRL